MENHAYTDHENNIQRVCESTGAKFSCVTVSQPAYALLYRMDHFDSMHYPHMN